MYTLEKLLLQSMDMNASDLHIADGAPPYIRVNGELIKIGDENIGNDEVRSMVSEVLKYNSINDESKCEIDTSYEIKKQGRFRVNIFKSEGKYAMAIRIIKSSILNFKELNAPPILRSFTKEDSGLVLVTGCTGCGKSTTLASMIDEINNTRTCHIITFEDPIEYIYKNNKSIINQREIGKDTLGYEEGLQAALREDPDVILIGELRKPDTIKAAVNAAETGHLVFSTLHTLGAAGAVDRIINVFPKDEQDEIRLQLSMVLRGVVWQKLIKTADNKGRIAAFEVMNVIPSIRKLIREGKTYQIPSIIQMGKKYGMLNMQMSIAHLYDKGYISKEEVVDDSSDKLYIDRRF